MFGTNWPPPDPYATMRPGECPSRQGHSHPQQQRGSRDSLRANVVTSRGTEGEMRDMFISADQEGRRMAHVGQAKGDYVQVTTFRYVGQGGGEFNMQHMKPEPKPAVSWQCWLIALCALVAMPVLAWIVLPEQTDFGSLFQQTGSIFVTNNQLIHAGPTTTTTPGLSIGGISFTLRVDNVDYARLAANPKAYRAFVFAVKEAVVFYTGHGVTTKRTSITLRRAFQTVRADIVPPCGTDVRRLETGMNFTSLARAVTANLHTVGGWRHSIGSPVSAIVVNSGTFAAACDVPTAEPSADESLIIQPETSTSPPELEPTTTTATPKPASHNAVVIAGAGGPSSFQVNGVYVLQKGDLHRKPVFKKDKTVDVWLAFVKGRWYVTDTQRKDDNTGGGWLYSVDVDSPDPTSVEEWQEWDGQKWASVPAINVEWRAESEGEGSSIGSSTSSRGRGSGSSASRGISRSASGSGSGSGSGSSSRSSRSSHSNSTSDEDPLSGGKLQFQGGHYFSRQMLRSSAKTAPHFKVLARRSGCSNWMEIKLGLDLVMGSPLQCGERCQRTDGCVGFNFFDIVNDTACATGTGPETGSDPPGSCSLWNGTCVTEHNRCWTNYAMAT